METVKVINIDGINYEVGPARTSQLVNDSNYVTGEALTQLQNTIMSGPIQSINTKTVNLENKKADKDSVLPLSGGDMTGDLYAPAINTDYIFATEMTCESFTGDIFNVDGDNLYFNSEGVKVMNKGSELYSLVTKAELDKILKDINSALESIQQNIQKN